MRTFVILLFLINSQLYINAQSDKSWIKLPNHRTEVFDVVEVNNGFIASFLIHQNDSIFTDAFLVKLDPELNIIDTIALPSRPNHHSSPPTMYVYGDSVFVYFQETMNTLNHISYKHIVTYDHDLNGGYIYEFLPDSLYMNSSLTNLTDTSFLFVGGNRGAQDNSLYVFTTDLRGNIQSQNNVFINRQPFFIISPIRLPNSNQILISDQSPNLIYYNMINQDVDSMVTASNVIRNLYAFPNEKVYGLQRNFALFSQVNPFSTSGEEEDVFLIDSSFTPENNAEFYNGILHGLDYEPLTGNMYAHFIHKYRIRRPGWSSGVDTVVAEIVVYKYDPVANNKVWKRKFQIYNIIGGSMPPNLMTIKATSDGGCIATFNAYSEDSTNLQNPPHGFILRLGPNGELLSQTSFEAPKPQISIYPNPAKESLFINSHQTAVEITINDVSGRVVYQSPSRQFQHQVNVQEWPSGMYVVQMTGKDGKRWTEKVLVE